MASCFHGKVAWQRSPAGRNGPWQSRQRQQAAAACLPPARSVHSGHQPTRMVLSPGNPRSHTQNYANAINGVPYHTHDTKALPGST